MRREEVLRAAQSFADRVHAHRIYNSGVNHEDKRLPKEVVAKWLEMNSRSNIVRFM